MKFLTVLPALCVLLFRAGGIKAEDQAYNFDEDNIDLEDEDKASYETRCWGELGCFDNSIGDRLPSEPDSIPPNYLLFPHDTGIKMSWEDTVDDLRNKTIGRFDEERRLIFLTHGFGESLGKQWIWNLRNATFKAYPNSNVVIIDWGKGAYLPLYNRAAANVPMIANMTMRLTSKLMSIYPTIKAENIYFIGFSLGAQMAGYFARTFTNQTGTKIGRITSLDAAAPNFHSLNIAPRRGDADFVEAIHTSAGDNIITGKVGYVPPYADIDFYPNGGIKQPGCPFFHLPCSHQRAFVYLTHALEDLAGCQFRGVRCATVEEANKENCTGPAVDAHIGQVDLEKFTRLDDDYHIVYLKTTSKSPFCTVED
ncbi:lipase member H [Galendromus occidentalis]|uniref:Lipase member H n=1 Tax=Galendromus occidentalis TaxID=34638 RepID=A0AAJ6VX64_9ACAR|nr:lipase member H [Galendromus occidentalis]